MKIKLNDLKFKIKNQNKSNIFLESSIKKLKLIE